VPQLGLGLQIDTAIIALVVSVRLERIWDLSQGSRDSSFSLDMKKYPKMENVG